VRELLRVNRRWFVWSALAALAFRLFFLWRFPAVVDDSRLYANIAENWLTHHVYGITDSGVVVPTLSRLPGYPAFLAAIFSVCGVGHFRPVLFIQVLFDLASCLLIADLARRLISRRAAKVAFLLAALCPFLANYAATALTETLEVFFTALAIDLAISALELGGLHAPRPSSILGSLTLPPPGWTSNRELLAWLACGLAVAGAILLRPDGGIVLGVIGLYLIASFAVRYRGTRSAAVRFRPLLLLAMLCAGALAPLAPWTLRNYSTFRRFEPLAPRYANDADEPANPGFNAWVKTWIADYVSVEEIYWNVPGESLPLQRLPNRAFDSPDQRARTESLLVEYNEDHDLTPELDARFAALAAERIRAAPLRYYAWLPALRIADMWLRPRTELFAADPRWWEFDDEWPWLALSLSFGLMNLGLVVLAKIGAWQTRAVPGIGLLIAFVLCRSLFLGTLENPEPRYTLECYPAVLVLAAAVLAHWRSRQFR
jgi:4-amino-4-deoxy-L-arabinose transferase-like glycosyltransferase